jgi:gas vesicle protein
VVGAGAALLLAPEKGVDTRRRINTTAQHLRDGMNGKMDRVQELKDSVTRHASELKDDVREAVEAGRAAASGDNG